VAANVELSDAGREGAEAVRGRLPAQPAARSSRSCGQRSSAYHGLVEARSNAKSWQSQYYPPFVGHIIDASLAAIVDGKLSFRVKPRPRFFDPDEFKAVQAGAKAHEILHGAQLKADRFHETEQPFALQDAIYGLTAYKNYWRRDVRIKPRLKVVPDETAAEQGVFLPRLVESEGVDVCYDGPTSEVVNIEDFFWHEASVSLQKAPVIAHRVWAHFSRAEAARGEGPVPERRRARERAGPVGRLRRLPRHRRHLAVARHDRGARDLVAGAGRDLHRHARQPRVELSPPRKNPFWHGEYPFVVCSTRPDLFSIPGKSQVEKIAALQEGHWDLFNQLLDNVKLMNNAIFIIGDDVIDPDSLEFAPGARWPVEGNPNEMVMPWAPNPISAEIAVPHLSRLEQMMQNLAGGYPFTTTSEAGTSNANTATQAALVTNIAQQATVRLKEQLAYAQERVGQQRTELNQQFLRTSIMVEQVGLDTEEEFVEIAPYLLNASSYLFDVAPMVESLMRSERRAEGNAMFQTFLQAAQIWVLLVQAGAATALNYDEFMREWLDSYDVGDVNRFFSSGRSRPRSPARSQLGSTDTPAPGITAPESIDPANSPSAQASLSGETHMARLGSQGYGGVANT
jgi:hypothetical protein